MIFVTVGSQLPFDRLVKSMDDWAAIHPSEVFAQIGDSTYHPKNFKFCDSITPTAYQQAMKKADLIISHVGTGVIITALELGKPLLLMPRLVEYKEIRNNHQLTSIQYFSKFPTISIVGNEHLLIQTLENRRQTSANKTSIIKPKISNKLLTHIRDFAFKKPQTKQD